ncbi:hypothetical protein D3C78_1611130 [compost metagenome]
MSLIESARLNGHDPYAYLKDVLDIFYASAAWKQGPRANIISLIEVSTTTVMALTRNAINAIWASVDLSRADAQSA